MSVRVNTVSIGAASTSASAYSATIPAGTGIIAGDVIWVSAVSNGTHVLNGITCQDSVNLTNFTQIKEQQLGGASAYYQQTFYYVAAANIADLSLITLTPYAGATDTNFSVDIHRYALGTITNAVVSQANTASTSQAAPALAAAPAIGNLVLTFDAAAGAGALTQGAAFTAGSTQAGTASRTANAFASADGTSTFASTWTDAGSVVSATQTVALKNAGVGVPYAIGSTAQAAGSSSTVVSVTKTTNANDAFFCCVGTGAGSTVTPTGVTDTKSHTWTQIGSFVAPNGMACYVYQVLNAATTLVGSTDTVTVAWSGTTYAKFAEVIACAGINQTAALDLTKTASASSGAPAATTDTSLTNNNELILSLITAGSASQGITWASPVTAMDAGLHTTGGVYFSVGTQVVTSNTAPATAGATLGATAVWGELLLTLLPDPPTGLAATVTITNTSPLTAAQVGVAYTNQLVATGGTSPYTWSVSAGSLPPGLILEPGGGGGSSGDFKYVGANTGPQGAPTLAGFTSQYPNLGPIGCYKVFYSTGGGPGALYTGQLGGDANGGSNAFSNGLEGQIVNWAAANGHPQPFIYVSWATVMSASAINNYCSQIPHSVREVGFAYQSEQEMAYPLSQQGGAQFVQDWTDQANKIRAAQANTPVKLTLLLASGMQHYQDGTLTNSWFIPPASVTDVYGLDLYDRFRFWAGSDMSTTKGWAVWMPMVRNLGKPLALTEYGISGSAAGMTAAQQNTRLQADWNYLKSAFGPGGSVSQLPLYVWLYWNTDGNSLSQSNNINQMMSAAMQNTWAGIAATQSGSGGGGGGGGLLIGTPTTTAGSPFSFTAKATDTNAAFGTKAFSLSVTSSSALAITTTSPLPGGTTGAAYSTILSASGGTVPYTWSLQSGTLPAGLSIAGQSITGTPTTAGTSAFTLKVTDNVAATATLAVSLTISSTLAITTTSPLPGGTVGTSYTTTLAAAGGTTPYTWTVTSGSLPTGLALDLNAGTISGIPVTAGASTLTITVTDSASATAATVFALPVASSGVLQAPGRRQFGGGIADFTITAAGTSISLAPSATATFWNALTGGSQYTDLQNLALGAITSVTSDANGELPVFYGPAGVWAMAADAGGGQRRWMFARDAGDFLTAIYSSVHALGG